MKKRTCVASWMTIMCLAIPCAVFTSCDKDDEENSVSTTGESAGAGQSYHPNVAATDPSALCPDVNHPHLIDLGTGAKWACCNVGSNSPEGYGHYLAWGEIYEKMPKNPYPLSADEEHKSPAGYSDKTYTVARNVDNISGNNTYDAARCLWGNPWRMPTLADIQDLLEKCSTEWTTVNGTYGRKFVGPNGNQIFLPAAGRYIGTQLANPGIDGYYWTGTLRKDPDSNYDNDYAHYLHLTFNTAEDYYYWERWIGRTIRAVAE